MKIAIYGSTGTIGQRIVAEAVRRGHAVTAIVREPSRVTAQNSKLQAVAGDVLELRRRISTCCVGLASCKGLVRASQHLIERAEMTTIIITTSLG